MYKRSSQQLGIIIWYQPELLPDSESQLFQERFSRGFRHMATAKLYIKALKNQTPTYNSTTSSKEILSGSLLVQWRTTNTKRIRGKGGKHTHTAVERAHASAELSEVAFQICFQSLLAHSLSSNEMDIDYAEKFRKLQSFTETNNDKNTRDD